MKKLSIILLLSICSNALLAMESAESQKAQTASLPSASTSEKMTELITPGARCCCPHDHEDEKSLEAGEIAQEISAVSAQQASAQQAVIPADATPASPETPVALQSANPLTLELLQHVVSAQTTISGTKIKETSYDPETQCAQINHEQVENYLNGILSDANAKPEDKAKAEQLLTKLCADRAKFACLAANLEHNMAAMHNSLLCSALEMAFFQQQMQLEMANMSRTRAPIIIPTFWDLLF